MPELINELKIKGTKTVAEAYFDYYIMATEAGIELPDAVFKIGTAGKWQYFQKDFFYRFVGYRRKKWKQLIRS
jgi:hypothetical protein